MTLMSLNRNGGIEMSTGKIDEKYLEGLKSGELLLKFTRMSGWR